MDNMSALFKKIKAYLFKAGICHNKKIVLWKRWLLALIKNVDSYPMYLKYQPYKNDVSIQLNSILIYALKKKSVFSL